MLRCIPCVLNTSNVNFVEENEGESRTCPLATVNKTDKQLVAFCLNFLELQLKFYIYWYRKQSVN